MSAFSAADRFIISTIGQARWRRLTPSRGGSFLPSACACFSACARAALAGLAGAEWAWQITYPVTEGDSPSSSIIAMVSGVTAAALLTHGAHYTLTRDIRS